MKCINLAWESDRLGTGSGVTASWMSPSKPIIIRGYNFKLSMIPSDSPWVGSLKSAQVLWFCSINNTWDSTDDWGPTVLKDSTGTSQNLHGTNPSGNQLVASILKASPWYYSVNDVLIQTDLNILVPANTQISQFAGFAGNGPVDFEVQGGLYYDEAPQ